MAKKERTGASHKVTARRAQQEQHQQVTQAQHNAPRSSDEPKQ